MSPLSSPGPLTRICGCKWWTGTHSVVTVRAACSPCAHESTAAWLLRRQIASDDGDLSAQSHAHPRLPFFASRLRLGREGVETVLPLGQLSAYEEEGLKVFLALGETILLSRIHLRHTFVLKGLSRVGAFPGVRPRAGH